MTLRLYLRPVDSTDAGLIAGWFNDTENAKYMSTWVRCRDHTEESIGKAIRESDENFEHLCIVCRVEDDRPIGHAGIDGIDSHDKRAEIFYLIGDKGDKGRGYGKGVLKLLLDHAFNDLGLNSLLATSAVNNKASIAILEKTGFKRIGVRREYNRIDGEFIDEVFFDITRRDYLAATPKQPIENFKSSSAL